MSRGSGARGGREVPERTRWRGDAVRLEDVAAELDHLHRAIGGPDHGQALARTLNLVVAPCSDTTERRVERALEGLGDHTPSRTVVLRRHGVHRLDADLVVECSLPEGAGRVGVCHDRVVLTVDEARLEHASSLLAPLLVSDLPTVLWLPDAEAPAPDGTLLERTDHVLADAAEGGERELGRLAGLAAQIRVHDLAWGRLEFWRAATAAAFEPPDRRALLPRITALQLTHDRRSFAPALLLAGWIAARAGWRTRAAKRTDGGRLIEAERDDGGVVAISVRGSRGSRGCGGILDLGFGAGTEEVRISRGATISRLRDHFAAALRPVPAFARGYREAVTAAAGMASA